MKVIKVSSENVEVVNEGNENFTVAVVGLSDIIISRTDNMVVIAKKNEKLSSELMKLILYMQMNENNEK